MGLLWRWKRRRALEAARRWHEEEREKARRLILELADRLPPEPGRPR